MGAHRDEIKLTGSRRLVQEISENKHIDCLELEAAKPGIQAICDKEDVHILVQLGNVTAVIYFNNMGDTHSKPCNKVMRDIWLCFSKEGCHRYPRNS